MKVPNQVSIIIAVALVAILNEVAQMVMQSPPPGMTMAVAVAVTAVIGGIANVIQVWVNERKASAAQFGVASPEPFNWRRATRQWLLG